MNKQCDCSIHGTRFCQVHGEDAVKLNFEITPQLSIDQQLLAASWNNKAFGGYYTADGCITTWWSGLTYMEKLFLVDTLRRRIDVEHP